MRRIISIFILVSFITTSVKGPAYAQLAQEGMLLLPAPGVMVHLSPEFTPAHLLGLTVHPDDALKFDFLIHKGDDQLDKGQKKEEYTKLIKYFLASLTIPDEDQWVNLSPYEHDRVIKNDFGKTEMGRDLLAQDYLLKQITSSLMYPESGLGKKFWDRVYERAYKEYGSSSVPVNTFNKVWIVPDEAVVYESGNTAYIVKSHLKVMLEEDYLSLEKHTAISTVNTTANNAHAIGSKIIKEIILPELEREVNEGKNFALLRQIYSGMILATWYKRALKETLLGKVYANRSKVLGVDLKDPKADEIIYQQYLKAFKKGVFNYIKEDVDRYSQQTIPRKYFAGGFFKNSGIQQVWNSAMINVSQAMIVDQALAGPLEDRAVDNALVSFNPSMRSLVQFKRPLLMMAAGVLATMAFAQGGLAATHHVNTIHNNTSVPTAEVSRTFVQNGIAMEDHLVVQEDVKGALWLANNHNITLADIEADNPGKVTRANKDKLVLGTHINLRLPKDQQPSVSSQFGGLTISATAPKIEFAAVPIPRPDTLIPSWQNDTKGPVIAEQKTIEAEFSGPVHSGPITQSLGGPPPPPDEETVSRLEAGNQDLKDFIKSLMKYNSNKDNPGKNSPYEQDINGVLFLFQIYDNLPVDERIKNVVSDLVEASHSVKEEYRPNVLFEALKVGDNQKVSAEFVKALREKAIGDNYRNFFSTLQMLAGITPDEARKLVQENREFMEQKLNDNDTFVSAFRLVMRLDPSWAGRLIENIGKSKDLDFLKDFISAGYLYGDGIASPGAKFRSDHKFTELAQKAKVFLQKEIEDNSSTPKEQQSYIKRLTGDGPQRAYMYYIQYLFAAALRVSENIPDDDKVGWLLIKTERLAGLSNDKAVNDRMMNSNFMFGENALKSSSLDFNEFLFNIFHEYGHNVLYLIRLDLPMELYDHTNVKANNHYPGDVHETFSDVFGGDEMEKLGVKNLRFGKTAKVSEVYAGYRLGKEFLEKVDSKGFQINVVDDALFNLISKKEGPGRGYVVTVKTTSQEFIQELENEYFALKRNPLPALVAKVQVPLTIVPKENSNIFSKMEVEDEVGTNGNAGSSLSMELEGIVGRKADAPGKNYYDIKVTKVGIRGALRAKGAPALTTGSEGQEEALDKIFNDINDARLMLEKADSVLQDYIPGQGDNPSSQYAAAARTFKQALADFRLFLDRLDDKQKDCLVSFLEKEIGDKILYLEQRSYSQEKDLGDVKDIANSIIRTRVIAYAFGYTAHLGYMLAEGQDAIRGLNVEVNNNTHDYTKALMDANAILSLIEDHQLLKEDTSKYRDRRNKIRLLAQGLKKQALAELGIKYHPAPASPLLSSLNPVGGIDLNSANMNLFIKRDGHGVPLPLLQQDWAQLSQIKGFVPTIIEIRPVIDLPILSELQQKLRQSPTSQI